MKINFILLLLFFLFSSCSKKGVTPTQVKLNMGGITNFANGIGAGGGILFGRSSSGEIFGHVLTGLEDNLDLPNGDWTFFTFLWESTTAGVPTPMNNAVYCGKSIQQLTGAAVNVNMNLTNAICTDPEFSNGKNYYDAATAKNRFADFFLEECNQLPANMGSNCGLKNQGSALSYRMVFKEFYKKPNSEFNFKGPAIFSACQKIDKSVATDLLHKGLPVNFPSGNGQTPFAVSLELFPGNDTCTPDAKGVFNISFNQGLTKESSSQDRVITSSTICSTDSSIGSISRFANAVECSGTLASANIGIKHLVSIPKSFICDRYNNQSSTIGSNPFAGGNGSIERPFKICTEWQMNQIGEVDAPPGYETKSYELMNDLDMNKADFLGNYSKPICVGQAGSVLKKHHNLNPLDRIVIGTCNSTGSIVGFSGQFNGHGYTIKNARISANTGDGLGFARVINGGTIQNIFFKNLEVEAKDSAGGIVGLSTNSILENISIDHLELNLNSFNNSSSYAGGIAGKSVNSTLNNVHIKNGKIKGFEKIGGLVGSNSGTIQNSHFSGELKSYDPSRQYIGGIVADNTSSGIISSAYSEGLIDSSHQYSGGIVANNTGTISNVYSTMTIQSRYSSALTYLGGIVANLGTGSLNGAYYDGVLIYKGTNTPSYGGVIALGSGSSANCFTTHTTPGGPCTNKTYAQMRLGTLTFSNAQSSWLQKSGSLPRLSWEYRECLLDANQATINTQVSNGKGTASNPIIICNSDQLYSMGGRPITEFYKMAEDINLSSWSNSNFIPIFTGSFDGGGNILAGLNFTGAGVSEYFAIFKTIASSGSIKNLKLFGNKIIKTGADTSVGTSILSGQNLGLIKNISLKANTVSGYTNVGLVSGINKNIISDIEISNNDLSGLDYVGSVAGVNNTLSTISKISINSMFIHNITGTSSFNNVGGAVGGNGGIIDQIKFGGTLSAETTGAVSNIGGIAGFNLGTISNSYTDNYSQITTTGTNLIGGLVGSNGSTGIINRSFINGKVIYSSIGAVAPVGNMHPLVGSNNSGGTIASDVYYLENSIASLRGYTSISGSCTGSSPNYTCSAVTPTAPITNSNLISYYNSTSSNSSNILFPITSWTGSNFTVNTNGEAPPAPSTNINFYSSYTSSTSNTGATGSRSQTQLKSLTNFCSSWTGSSGNEVCSSGYDIAEENPSSGISHGANRLYSYYSAIMNETEIPANAPIWEFNDNNNYPELVQLK